MDGTDFADFNRQVIEAFRASGGVGELGPVHFDRLVLLTTTGRRSGTAHTVPLGSARGEAYQHWMDVAPSTAGHQDQAGREIPMVLVPPAPSP